MGTIANLFIEINYSIYEDFRYNNIKILKSRLWFVHLKSGILIWHFEPLFYGEHAVLIK